MIRFAILRDAEALEELRPQWEALLQRTPDSSYFGSASYALDSWRIVAQPEGAELFCLAGFEGDTLQLVWPLKRYRRGPWHFVGPLCMNSAEYCDPLCGPGHSAAIPEAIDYLFKIKAADVLSAPMMSDPRVITAIAARSRLKITQDHPNFCVSWLPGESWDDYLATRSRSRQKKLGQIRRQLDALGGTAVILCRTEAEIAEAVDCMMQFKVRVAPRFDEIGAWVNSNRFCDLQKRLGRGDFDGEGLLVFKIARGDDIVAVQTVGVARRADLLMNGYHADYAKYSPGSLMNEGCLKWAHAHGMRLDFGAGLEDYKRHWAREEYTAISTKSAITLWGAAAVMTLLAARGAKSIRRPPARPTPAAIPASPAA